MRAVLPITPGVSSILLPLHAASVAAKQRFDDSVCVLKEVMGVPAEATVHLDLDAGTLSFETPEE